MEHNVWKERSLFLLNFLKNPLRNASVIPSSKEASRAILTGLDWDKIHTVVELGPGNGTFSIPPQARDHPVQAEMTLTSAATLYRMNPHMHLRGKRVRYEALYPNGKREVLLSVPDYDFNWQVGYALAEPKALPAGTRVVVSGAFDNSPQNLANPDPNARVTWGDQSWMEMFVGFLDYTQ